jgi:hypothetical protein
MNNTKNLTTIAAILMAATLVVGTAGTLVSTTKTAFAASNNNSGNTVTALKAQNKGSCKWI